MKRSERLRHKCEHDWEYFEFTNNIRVYKNCGLTNFRVEFWYANTQDFRNKVKHWEEVKLPGK
jgi:hypothetical protein